MTERINLASLKKYEEMELEARRKAMRTGKREIKGPVIRSAINQSIFRWINISMTVNQGCGTGSDQYKN